MVFKGIFSWRSSELAACDLHDLLIICLEGYCDTASDNSGYKFQKAT